MVKWVSTSHIIIIIFFFKDTVYDGGGGCGMSRGITGVYGWGGGKGG